MQKRQKIQFFNDLNYYRCSFYFYSSVHNSYYISSYSNSPVFSKSNNQLSLHTYPLDFSYYLRNTKKAMWQTEKLDSATHTHFTCKWMICRSVWPLTIIIIHVHFSDFICRVILLCFEMKQTCAIDYITLICTGLCKKKVNTNRNFNDRLVSWM